ncbi:hypothetical protein ACHMXB_01515 [Arthrobacter sp. UC242_113]
MVVVGAVAGNGKAAGNHQTACESGDVLHRVIGIETSWFEKSLVLLKVM